MGFDFVWLYDNPCSIFAYRITWQCPQKSWPDLQNYGHKTLTKDRDKNGRGLFMCFARAHRCRAQCDVLFTPQLVTILPHIFLSHFCARSFSFSFFSSSFCSCSCSYCCCCCCCCCSYILITTHLSLRSAQCPAARTLTHLDIANASDFRIFVCP